MISGLNTRLTDEMSKTYEARGFWPNNYLHRLVDSATPADGGKIAAIGYRTDINQVSKISYDELSENIDCLARSLVAYGIRAGDIVTVQLPNWYEFEIIVWAISRIGAVLNAMTPIYREREVSFILTKTKSKIMFIPRSFRRFDYVKMMESIKNDLPDLKHVVVLSDQVPGGFISHERFLLDGRKSTIRLPEINFSPNDLVQVAFTSGTTGEPKGAMHTHNTLIATISGVANHLQLTKGEVNLIASPVGHQTGFLWGVLMSRYLSGTPVYLDQWDPSVALKIIDSEKVTMTAGATPFLQDLTYASSSKSNYLRHFICAGAPIPGKLVKDALELLGCRTYSAWGMTEYGIATAVGPDADPAKISDSDGNPLPGAEIRIVNQEGVLCAPNVEGDLQVKGAGLFLGYFKGDALTNSSFTADGWFLTGDRAKADDDGFIRITGRTKDIIIRGGENVPVVEIENLLYRNPKVREVAIVGMPDERLYERACAFVVTRDGSTLTLEDLKEFLLSFKLAKQYLPERLELIDELPKTITGKIRKNILREIIRNKLADRGENKA